MFQLSETRWIVTADPTYSQMHRFLFEQYRGAEFNEDRDEAIFWFAMHHHGGQSTNLYRAILETPFDPGPAARLDADSVAGDMYRLLMSEYDEQPYSFVAAISWPNPSNVYRSLPIFDPLDRQIEEHRALVKRNRNEQRRDRPMDILTRYSLAANIIALLAIVTILLGHFQGACR